MSYLDSAPSTDPPVIFTALQCTHTEGDEAFEVSLFKGIDNKVEAIIQISRNNELIVTVLSDGTVEFGESYSDRIMSDAAVKFWRTLAMAFPEAFEKERPA
jgi:hypothetical protein